MDIAVEILDELVALVKQVVGGLPIALGAGDLVVDVGNVAGQAVDGVNFLRKLLCDAGLQVIQRLGGCTHVGALATSENALTMSLIDAPRPCGPPWNMPSSCLSLSERAASDDCVAVARVDWRVKNSLKLRWMVWMLTPWPI